MNKSRLEAFSDTVVAVIVGVMALGMRRPAASDWPSLTPLLPVLLAYLLGFLYLGIAWMLHHRAFQGMERANASIFWANLHWLFWVSLFPFAVNWLGDVRLLPAPAMSFGVLLLGVALAQYILQLAIIATWRADWRGLASVAMFAIGAVAGYKLPIVSVWLYGLAVLLWMAPEKATAG